MPITFTNDYATISTSEYSIPGDTTTSVPTSQTDDGVYQFFISLGNLQDGDQYRIRIYEKYDSSGTQVLVEEWIFTGTQSKPMFVSPTLVLGEGWDCTLLKTAGGDRAIHWSIRKIS